MELDVLGWVLAVSAAISVGLSKGGLPVISSLAVPLLAQVMNPVQAAGLLLPVYVASDMVGLWAWRKDFDRRVLAIVAPAALIGVGFGWATASLVPESAVAVLVGLIGTSFALNAIFRHPVVVAPRPPRVVPGLFWGAVAGFTSFVSHSGGPPWQVYALPLGMSKTRFSGTSTILFAFVNAAKLIPYYALGQLTSNSLGVASVLILPAALAVLAGVWLVRVMPQALFFRVVIWALLLISLRLIWQAV
ncbi:sulfite exporter TauE/SafE family protein [Phaeovulum sp.]|uniref:sulfite exporter TauE/SafE family protein n=1 Tax=Phaeovulum sp. TaxID=2934796 RepID=UPI0039E4CEE9